MHWSAVLDGDAALHIETSHEEEEHHNRVALWLALCAPALVQGRMMHDGEPGPVSVPQPSTSVALPQAPLSTQACISFQAHPLMIQMLHPNMCLGTFQILAMIAT